MCAAPMQYERSTTSSSGSPAATRTSTRSIAPVRVDDDTRARDAPRCRTRWQHVSSKTVATRSSRTERGAIDTASANAPSTSAVSSADAECALRRDERASDPGRHQRPASEQRGTRAGCQAATHRRRSRPRPRARRRATRHSRRSADASDRAGRCLRASTRPAPCVRARSARARAATRRARRPPCRRTRRRSRAATPVRRRARTTTRRARGTRAPPSSSRGAHRPRAAAATAAAVRSSSVVRRPCTFPARARASASVSPTTQSRRRPRSPPRHRDPNRARAAPRPARPAARCRRRSRRRPSGTSVPTCCATPAFELGARRRRVEVAGRRRGRRRLAAHSRLDRLVHRLPSGAAAEVCRERAVDVGSAALAPGDQRRRPHQDPRSAEPALRAAGGDERRGQPVPHRRVEPVERGDRPAGDPLHRASRTRPAARRRRARCSSRTGPAARSRPSPTVIPSRSRRTVSSDSPGSHATSTGRPSHVKVTR